MTVIVRFVCREIVGDARSGAYSLMDGSSIAQLMDLVAKENGTFINNYDDYLIYTVNHRLVTPRTTLHDGDSVTVLRKAVGG